MRGTDPRNSQLLAYHGIGVMSITVINSGYTDEEQYRAHFPNATFSDLLTFGQAYKYYGSSGILVVNSHDFQLSGMKEVMTLSFK